MWLTLKTGTLRNGTLIAGGIVVLVQCLSAPGLASAQPASSTPSPVAPPLNAAPAVPIGPPIALTLPEAVFIGLRDNLGVRSAYIQRVADKFNLYVAQYKFKPILGFAANLQRKLDQSQGTNGSRSDGYSVTPTATLNTITGGQFAFGWANQQGFAYSAAPSRPAAPPPRCRRCPSSSRCCKAPVSRSRPRRCARPR
jgi:hypothetical protein